MCDVPSGQEQLDNTAVESHMFTSDSKVMALIFWDNFRVILVDFIPSVTTVIADV
jgi:hypothetical protein